MLKKNETRSQKSQEKKMVSEAVKLKLQSCVTVQQYVQV